MSIVNSTVNIIWRFFCAKISEKSKENRIPYCTGHAVC